MDALITFLKVRCIIPLTSQYNLLSGDTVLHSWEVLAKILASEEAMGIVCDIGMYVLPRAGSKCLMLLQACRPQERRLQLSRYHPRPQNRAYPSKNVAR